MGESTRQRSAGLRRVLATVLPMACAIALVAGAFWMTAARAIELEMPTHPPVLVVNAIPVALSELLFGHTTRYTTLTSVRDRFEDRLPASFEATNISGFISAKDVNPAIRKVLEMDRSKAGTEITLLGPDDKGIVDLVELGFSLFGYRTESITTAYFLLLLASCTVYVAAFWRSPSRLMLVAAFLAMVYLAAPMVTYNAQLGSLLMLRVLPALSMVACLHCLLFMAASVRERVSAWQFGFVTIQIALIGFTLHMKTSTIWQVMTIVGFGIVVLVVANVRRLRGADVRWRSTALAVGTVCGLVLGAYATVQAYQGVALREYHRREVIATRVFWHNIFSGLSYHPSFAERYQIRIDDSSIYAATRDYLYETGRPDVWREMGGEEAGFAGMRFDRYEPVVREMLFARCTTFVRECAEALLYYKPVALAGNLAWLYGLRELPPNLEVVVSRNFGAAGEQVMRQYLGATTKMDQRGQRAYLWTPAVLLVILPFVALVSWEPRASTWTAAAGLAGLGLGSLIPTIVAYPVAHSILEPALTFGMVVYFVVCVAAARWLPRLFTSWQTGRPAVRAVEQTSG